MLKDIHVLIKEIRECRKIIWGNSAIYFFVITGELM
jgi:hypothetical protein